MNFRIIRKILGKVMLSLAFLMILPIIFCIAYHETFKNYLAFLIPAAGLALFGFLCTLGKIENNKMSAKEGFVIVGLAWLIMSLFGAIPFMISGVLPNFFDAFFEISSGFSTTGSTVMGDIESLVVNNHSVMMWRSFSHWIGGLGILVFILAIIPEASEGSALNILRAESSGQQVSKLVTKMKDSSRILYLIYIVLTITEIILLWVSPDMDFYDSLIHAFGTAGTGGFSNYNNSIAHFGAYVQYVIAIFMFLFGVNLNMYYFMLIGNFKSILKNKELRLYIILVAVCVAVICINTYSLYSNFEETFRSSLFQVTSIISTTGYGTYDFTNWPALSQTIILLLMFTGACAGSTAGGLKLSRVLIIIKSCFRKLFNYINPRHVKTIKIEERPLDDEVVNSTVVYFAIYMLILFAVTILISLDKRCDLFTNFTAALSCLSNIGPGFNLVGPSSNFGVTGANYSGFSKFVLSITMIAGRLELIPILLLFNPVTYIKK